MHWFVLLRSGESRLTSVLAIAETEVWYQRNDERLAQRKLPLSDRSDQTKIVTSLFGLSVAQRSLRFERKSQRTDYPKSEVTQCSFNFYRIFEHLTRTCR